MKAYKTFGIAALTAFSLGAVTTRCAISNHYEARKIEQENPGVRRIDSLENELHFDVEEKELRENPQSILDNLDREYQAKVQKIEEHKRIYGELKNSRVQEEWKSAFCKTVVYGALSGVCGFAGLGYGLMWRFYQDNPKRRKELDEARENQEESEDDFNDEDENEDLGF